MRTLIEVALLSVVLASLVTAAGTAPYGLALLVRAVVGL